MYVLGLWDGHDSGAALVRDNKVVFAANEERFTKRKLEIQFPANAVKAALDYEGIKPSDIEVVAFPTTELTKTLSRIFPWQKESYYKFRRRKMLKPRFHELMHYTKYSMTSIGILPLCNSISKSVIMRELRHIGFENPKLYHVEHHAAHAATAAFTSGFKKSLVITLDGLGDGLSGTVSTLSNGNLERVHAISARNSLGVFFEQVTNILGMRELEDEGKIMAMADYSFPFKFEDNKMKDLFSVNGTEIISKYNFIKQYDMLNRLSWSMPREQFAYMAQQIFENTASKFVENVINEYGINKVSFAGGAMSNIKANMKIRMLPDLKEWYIFPHMGDGGIALGAAMYVNYDLNGITDYKFENSYLGNEYSQSQINTALKKEPNIDFELDKAPWSHAAELINEDEYVFWFQGRMEYGPRALGNRSILAKPGSEDVKDKLNLYVKQREWYQPFAPSMLKEEAHRLLEDVKGYDKFMTMAYKVKPNSKNIMRSVVHVDLTARPQMLGNENEPYRNLLLKLKKLSGYGIVLNTSFNIHGMPIVMTPEDAIYTMKKTGTRYMFIGNYFVENKNSD
jgi:carbamoyltransferase